MLKIYNASSILEAELIAAILREHDIPSYCQNAPGNVVAHEVYGFGIYGFDVYVDEEHFEKAIEILHLDK